ncbi:ubiquinol-cytochrome C chaperone family protein [Blastomonas sp.]|uniref:ubiquinol-cytochrome C chaperone family protein n=1 Tax=Blastomonas sp. TaxID=1909299 RepID=UPI0035947EE3
MSVLSRLFSRSDPREAARPAYAQVIALGRDPYWYTDGGVADSVDGRFEAVALLLCLVLLRLEQDEDQPAVRQFSVHLAELFVDDMDGQLRQNGVGDLVVGKNIGKMMSALGGRLGVYRAALAADNTDMSALDSALRRNLYREEQVADAQVTAAAAKVRALHDRMAALPVADVMQGAIA